MEPRYKPSPSVEQEYRKALDPNNCLDHLVLRISIDRYPGKDDEVEYYECRKCGAKYTQAEVDNLWEAV